MKIYILISCLTLFLFTSNYKIYADDEPFNKIENIIIEADQDTITFNIFIKKVTEKINYNIDRVPSPNRLVINFNDTVIENLENETKLNLDIIKNINVKEYQKSNSMITEVVIGLAQFFPYNIVEENNKIMLQFENSTKIKSYKKELKISDVAVSKTKNVKAQKAPAVPDQIIQKTEIKKEDIKPGNKKEQPKDYLPKVIDLKFEEQANATIIKIITSEPVDYKLSELLTSHFLVIDIPYSNLEMKNSTLEINGPAVKRVRSGQFQIEPFKITRIVVELKENRPYLSSKNNSEIIVTIDKANGKQAEEKKVEPKVAPKVEPKPVQIAKVAEPQKNDKKEPEKEIKAQITIPQKSLSKTISLDLKDAEIGNVLRMLSTSSGINIIAGTDVKGTVTLRFENIAWEEALHNVLSVNGFKYRKEGSTIQVFK